MDTANYEWIMENKNNMTNNSNTTTPLGGAEGGSVLRFADIQMLRYELKDFETLSLTQKRLVYCLAQATLWGRDITFDQFGRYNLRIREVLEDIYSLSPTLPRREGARN